MIILAQSLLYVLLFVISFVQYPDPTLEETIEWLEGKISFTEFNNSFPVQDTKLQIDGNTKILTITNIYYMDNSFTAKQKYMIKIPINTINLNSLKIVSENNSVQWLYLYPNNNKPTFEVTSYYYSNPKEITQFNISSTYIRFPLSVLKNDSEFASRTKKAMFNLIKFCGGKGEAY